MLDALSYQPPLQAVNAERAKLGRQRLYACLIAVIGQSHQHLYVGARVTLKVSCSMVLDEHCVCGFPRYARKTAHRYKQEERSAEG